MADRLTQTAVESLVPGTPHVRSTATGIEGVIVASPHVRLTQIAIEVITPYQPLLSGPTQFISTYFPQFIRGLSLTALMKTAEFFTTMVSAPNVYATTLINSRNPIWHFTLIYNYLKNNPKDTVPIYSPWTDYEILHSFFLSMGGMAQPFLLTDPGTALGSPDNYVGPALLNLPWQANRVYIPSSIIVAPSGHAQQAIAVTGPSSWTAPAFSTSGGSVSDGGVSWQDLGMASGTQPNPNAQLQLLTDGNYWYSPIQRNFGGQFLEDITDLNQIPTLGGSTLAVCAAGLPIQSSAYQLLGPGLLLPTTSFAGAYLRFIPWRQFTAYLVGQLFIDPAGHLQQAQTPGATGPLAPNWNDSGGTTRDGNVLWKDLGLAAPITSSFNFFFRVHFEMDELDFEQFLSQVYTIGGPDAKNGAGYLKLETFRPNRPLPPGCEVYPNNL